MSKLHNIMSDKERKECPPFSDAELIIFLWDVREEKNIMGVKRSDMLRLFSTIADKQNG